MASVASAEHQVGCSVDGDASKTCRASRRTPEAEFRRMEAAEATVFQVGFTRRPAKEKKKKVKKRERNLNVLCSGFGNK